MSYSLSTRRWASLGMLLALGTLATTISLLGIYTPHEMEIGVSFSSTYNGREKTDSNTGVATITFVVFTLVLYLWMAIRCLLVMMDVRVLPPWHCYRYNPEVRSTDMDCCSTFWEHILALGMLIMLCISFALNVTGFGWIPQTPLQGIVLLYMIVFVAVPLAIGSTVLLWIMLKAFAKIWCVNSVIPVEPVVAVVPVAPEPAVSRGLPRVQSALRTVEHSAPPAPSKLSDSRASRDSGDLEPYEHSKCSICLEVMSANLQRLPCGHFFHSVCLSKREVPGCPDCV